MRVDLHIVMAPAGGGDDRAIVQIVQIADGISFAAAVEMMRGVARMVAEDVGHKIISAKANLSIIN